MTITIHVGHLADERLPRAERGEGLLGESGSESQAARRVGKDESLRLAWPGLGIIYRSRGTGANFALRFRLSPTLRLL
jgi:hypothetical protein